MSKAITDSPATTTQNKSEANAINCETISQVKVTMLRLGFAVSSVISIISIHHHCLYVAGIFYD